jgi:DNA-nicking Smr family endonuclease
MSRRRGLDADDAALWQQVADTIHPLRRRQALRERVDRDGDAAPVGERPASGPPAPALEPPPTGRRQWQPLVTTPVPKPVMPPPTAQGIDRRQAKKIARGHVAIDGRLDLHGLREAEAHMRLRGFLRQAQAQGSRIVLVITGKGSDDDANAPIDWRTGDWNTGTSRRGVLKRNVPRWLTEPDLAALVVSFGPAHVRHGGDGALYVHLRQRR